MGMMEDMQMMQYLQQAAAGQEQGQQPMGGMPQQGMQQPQMPQQAPQARNPLEAGSRAAVEAAKRSLEMSDSENQRALGRALMGMASGMRKSQSYGQGFIGNIGAISDGFAPALSAYDSERDRIMNMNYMISQKQKEEAAAAKKEEREMRKMSHEMDMSQKNLKINEGYLNLKRKEKEDERREIEMLSKPGGEVPLGTLSTNGWIYAQKYLDSSAKELEGAKKAINSIDEASEILERNPNITKHWATILSASQQDDPTYLQQQLLNRVNKNDLKDAQLLSKNLSNLYTAEGSGVSARAMNKYWEKEMKKGVATPDLLASTTLHLFKDSRKHAVDKYKSNFDVHDSFHNKGVFKRAKPTSLDYDPEETTKYANKNPENSSSSFSNLSPEQAEARKAQIRAQLGQ
jgi:hypothetical protein